jgi:hypothetical protein
VPFDIKPSTFPTELLDRRVFKLPKAAAFSIVMEKRWLGVDQRWVLSINPLYQRFVLFSQLGSPSLKTAGSAEHVPSTFWTKGNAAL